MQLEPTPWLCTPIQSSTRCVPQDGTQSQSIWKLKTISRTKALLTVHYFLHDASPLPHPPPHKQKLLYPCKEKSLCPSPSKFSLTAGSCLFFFLLALSHCHKTPHQMGGEQGTPWGAGKNGAGQLRQQEVLSVPCVWHPLPQNPWPSTLFRSHNQPPTKQGPWSMSVTNSHLPDGGSMAHLSFGHSKSLLAPQGSGLRAPEMKPGCFCAMQNNNKAGQRHVLQEEHKYLSPEQKKKKGRFKPQVFSQAFDIKTVEGFNRSHPHPDRISELSVNELMSPFPFLALNLLDQLCHSGQAVSELTKEKVIKAGMHPNFWKTVLPRVFPFRFPPVGSQRSPALIFLQAYELWLSFCSKKCTKPAVKDL